MGKIDKEELKKQRESQKQLKEKQILEQFFTPKNPIEKSLQKSDEQALAKAIQELLKKDRLH